jgi:hypothetical protein
MRARVPVAEREAVTSLASPGTPEILAPSPEDEPGARPGPKLHGYFGSSVFSGSPPSSAGWDFAARTS